MLFNNTEQFKYIQDSINNYCKWFTESDVSHIDLLHYVNDLNQANTNLFYKCLSNKTSKLFFQNLDNDHYNYKDNVFFNNTPFNTTIKYQQDAFNNLFKTFYDIFYKE